MCTTEHPVISQLTNHAVFPRSISGEDAMNLHCPMVLEFFADVEEHATCEGEILLGTRFYYFPFSQMRAIVTALRAGKAIKVAGLEHESGAITRIDWMV